MAICLGVSNPKRHYRTYSRAWVCMPLSVSNPKRHYRTRALEKHYGIKNQFQILKGIIGLFIHSFEDQRQMFQILKGIIGQLSIIV